MVLTILTILGANDRHSHLRRRLIAQYRDTGWNMVPTKCHSSQCHRFACAKSGLLSGRRASSRFKQLQYVSIIIILEQFPHSNPDTFSYMYGGRDASSRYFDEVWVLSLPSFTWTQVFKGTSPRFAHTCHLVGNRTLLTVGGVSSIKQKSGHGGCDWETKGVAVMDLTDVTWGSVYDAHAPAYGVPAGVIATIGGR